MKPKLIVTAHDFGLCDSVNDGTLWLLKHKNNFVTELSLLPNAPKSQKAAELIKQSELNISISLNTNFTTFKPIHKDVSSLVDRDGNFKKVDVGNWDFSNLNSFETDDIRKELDAQWNWFVDNLGMKPTAILSRKSEFSDPKLLIPFVEKAQQENVPLRSPVWGWKANYAAQSYAKQEGVKTTGSINIAVKDWKGRFGFNLENDQDREKLISKISKVNGVAELLVFPGFVDKELFQISAVNWQRGQILKIIENDKIVNQINQSFDLISFKDI